MREPSRAQLIRAVELAKISRDDRDEAQALTRLLYSSGFDRLPELVDTLWPIARAAVERTGNAALAVRAKTNYGRALVQVRKLAQGRAECTEALAAAQTLDGTTERDRARDCLIEALSMMGANDELEPLLAIAIADTTRSLGPDHPKIGDYLRSRVVLRLGQGKIAEARADAERSLEIRRKVYPPDSVKIVEGLADLADVAAVEDKPEVKRLYQEVLAKAEAIDPPALSLLCDAHQQLAYIAQHAGDHTGAVEHFEAAIAITRQRAGNDSLELGLMLLAFSQIKANGDVDGGLALIEEARNILLRNHDRRAGMAVEMMALVEVAAKRWAGALKHAEECVASFDAHTEPIQVALGKRALAEALAATKGDLARARRLAREARDLCATLGPAYAANVTELDAWLA